MGIINKAWMVALVAATLAVLFASECGPGATRVQVGIAAGSDNGEVIALTEVPPDGSGGFLVGDGNQLAIGGILYRDRYYAKVRAMYRFDVSKWSEDKGAVTFHGYCTGKQGSPGDIVAYVIKDFGWLPSQYVESPYEVTPKWELPDKGSNAGRVTSAQSQGFEVEISSFDVEKYRSEDGYVALMLEAFGEGAGVGNYYTVSSYESPDHKPYISWKA